MSRRGRREALQSVQCRQTLEKLHTKGYRPLLSVAAKAV